METALEDLVQQARDGKKDTLESLVGRIQDRVYGLALRMLGYPAEAEDAAQEILIKVVTRLDSFRRESEFSTWVYRVAANHENNLKTIERPTLILWGEDDTFLPLSLGDRIHKDITGSKMERIPNCGHFVPEDQPERATKTIVEFLGR